MKIIRIKCCGDCPYLYYGKVGHRTDVVLLRCMRNGAIDVIPNARIIHPDCPLEDAKEE